MLLNHKRLTVWKHDEKGETESRCPLCEQELVGRRGEMVIWHWAHHARRSSVETCGWEESTWHLRWKLVYLKFNNWNVEQKQSVGSKTYILDAVNRNTGRVREFVHTLSPYYAEKHLALRQCGFDVLWIWDGGEFVSERRVRTFDGRGLRRFLKPRAQVYHSKIRGLVHFSGRLWREWRDNVYYPVDGNRASKVVELFARTQTRMEDR